MQVVATGWLVLQLTNSAFQLGLLGLLRALPVMILAMIGGTVADIFDRRRLLLITQTVLLLIAAILAVTTATGTVSMPLIYALTVIAGATNAFDNPARQSLIPNLVPREELTAALTLNITTFQLGQIVGPLIGGIVVASFGAQGAYAIDALSFVAVLIALLLLRARSAPNSGERAAVNRGVGAIVEGFVFVRRNGIILSVMLLDFLATLFGSVQALLPIFARDVLHVGAAGLLSTRGSIRAQGPILLIAIGIFGLCLVGFGLSHTFWLSLIFLAGSGAADTISIVLRGSILQIATPDELRGRTTAVHMAFAMGGPQLGQLRAGLVASLIGPLGAAATGGVACIAVVIAIAAFIPKIRHYRV